MAMVTVTNLLMKAITTKKMFIIIANQDFLQVN